MPDDRDVSYCEVCKHTASPHRLHGTVASMRPHMISVQPPSLERGPFPEVLGPPPHFPLPRGYVCRTTGMSRTVKFASTPHLLTDCMGP